jgi:hypothetical protein
LWGGALAAHVVGNFSQPDLPSLLGIVNLAVGLIGTWLVVKPRRGSLLVASALVVVSVGLEMPFTGNHWLVAGLVSLVVLVSGGRPHGFLPGARWVLLVFYSFAAFAKLNTGFLDPDVSCAVFYSNQMLTSYGLGSLTPTSPVASIAIWTTVLVELSVPILLIVRRTRYWGVALGTVFHVLISFDLSQHFFDFTSVLVALFMLFLPDESIERLESRQGRIAEATRRRALLMWVMITALLVLLASLPVTAPSQQLLETVPFAIWIPFSLLWCWQVLRVSRPGERLPTRLSPALALVVLLTFVNGLTPYTEIKTAYGFNMYANLVTAGGESNHLVIRSTMPLRDGYKGPVEIIRSSDPGLELYRDRGYLIAYPQLRRYLAVHPEVSLEYRRNGQVVAIDRASQNPELVEPGPWWWRFLPLRAIDRLSPPRCQDVFLPAL